MRLVAGVFCALFWCLAANAQSGELVYPWDTLRELRDAPLSEPERADIYRVLDEAARDAGMASEERRPGVLSALVTDTKVRAGGLAQVLVSGGPLFCGAANCPLWLFLRESGHLRLILQTDGTDLVASATARRGFHDLVAGSHVSAFEQIYRIYRWNGQAYAQVDRYVCRFDRGDPDRLLGTDARCRRPMR